MEAESDTEVLTDVYHALRTPRRCYVIRILAETDEESLSTRTLAERITTVEEGTPVELVGGSAYRNVYNSLSQSHLPTLSETKVIIYDSDRQVIRTGPRFQFAVLVLSISRTTYQTLID